MRIALYQPDIPQNTGTILRLGGCLGVPVDIIEPCGFAWSDRHLRRAGMDYLDRVDYRRHDNWERFQSALPGRLVLLSTQAQISFTDFAFGLADTILLGQESAGVPEYVHRAADERVLIPMVPGMRSINVAMAAAMVLGEALRQIGAFPDRTKEPT